MPKIQATAADVEALGAKLDSLGDKLTDGDRALIAAAFQIAGDHVAESGEEVSGFGLSPASNLSSFNLSQPLMLKDNLKSSFNPALENLGTNAFDLDIHIKT